MSDPRPADQPQNDALRSRLEAWLNRQNQALLEGVMASWQQGLERFQPDATLLAELREAMPIPEAPVPKGPDDRNLAAALDLLEGATSQSDLLKRLLDALALLAERSALFILKQGSASLYAQRGFEVGAPVKAGVVMPPQELEDLISGMTRSIRQKGKAYTALLAPVSSLEAPDVALFALLHKRRAVALVLVDSGQRPQLEHPEQVRALVLAASAMLGLLAAGKEEEPRLHSPIPPAAAIAPAAAVAPVSAIAPVPAMQPQAHQPPHAPQPPASSAPTRVASEPTEPALFVDLDPKIRAAAERLARVLVGDVELYFPAKVAQARAQGNLYQQLRPELERSRATFVERFGEDVENRHRIFTTTLIQLLCDGEASKLGPAPWA